LSKIALHSVYPFKGSSKKVRIGQSFSLIVSVPLRVYFITHRALKVKTSGDGPLDILSITSNCVYMWSAVTSRVTKLCDLGDDDTVTSVSWAVRGPHLSVGTNKGDVQIWDANTNKKLRTMTGHRQRVGATAWNGYVLSTGSRDHSIYQRDVRQQQHHFMKLTGHRQEVCGLRWSYDESQLASGGNDNKLLIWNLRGE
jgi:cell division cycle 20-like protein 1, cofactor of APC complex